jgi:hypothetical protein
MSLRFLYPRSLKTRVTLATLLVLLLCIGVLGTYAGRVMREDLGQHLGEQQFATVSLLAAQIDQELTDRLIALEMVAAEIGPAVLANTANLQHRLENRPVLLPSGSRMRFAANVVDEYRGRPRGRAWS